MPVDVLVTLPVIVPVELFVALPAFTTLPVIVPSFVAPAPLAISTSPLAVRLTPLSTFSAPVSMSIKPVTTASPSMTVSALAELFCVRVPVIVPARAALPWLTTLPVIAPPFMSSEPAVWFVRPTLPTPVTSTVEPLAMVITPLVFSNVPAPPVLTLTVVPAPPLNTMFPALVMPSFPDASWSAVSVPFPAKTIPPPARLLIAPASVTVPRLATFSAAALFSVLPVPIRVDPTPILIPSEPALLLIVPADSETPSAIVTPPSLIASVPATTELPSTSVPALAEAFCVRSPPIVPASSSAPVLMTFPLILPSVFRMPPLVTLPVIVPVELFVALPAFKTLPVIVPSFVAPAPLAISTSPLAVRLTPLSTFSAPVSMSIKPVTTASPSMTVSALAELFCVRVPVIVPARAALPWLTTLPVIAPPFMSSEPAVWFVRPTLPTPVTSTVEPLAMVITPLVFSNVPAPPVLTLTVVPAPPLNTMFPALVMPSFPDASWSAVSVPFPAKTIPPPARLLIAPASVTVPRLATFSAAALFSVLPVPIRVDPTPILIPSEPALLLIVPADSETPSAIVTPPSLIASVPATTELPSTSVPALAEAFCVRSPPIVPASSSAPVLMTFPLILPSVFRMPVDVLVTLPVIVPVELFVALPAFTTLPVIVPSFVAPAPLAISTSPLARKWLPLRISNVPPLISVAPVTVDSADTVVLPPLCVREAVVPPASSRVPAFAIAPAPAPDTLKLAPPLLIAPPARFPEEFKVPLFNATNPETEPVVFTVPEPATVNPFVFVLMVTEFEAETTETVPFIVNASGPVIFIPLAFTVMSLAITPAPPLLMNTTYPSGPPNTASAPFE